MVKASLLQAASNQLAQREDRNISSALYKFHWMGGEFQLGRSLEGLVTKGGVTSARVGAGASCQHPAGEKSKG